MIAPCVLYLNPRYIVLLKTVVVGSTLPIARKLAPHVNALAVPLSSIRIINDCPSVGVPDGLLKSNAPACAVTLYWSTESEAIVVLVT